MKNISNGFLGFRSHCSLEIPVDHHSALESLGERMSSDDLDRIVLTGPVATMARTDQRGDRGSCNRSLACLSLVMASWFFGSID